ncbi:acetamidase/formamidase family protein [Microlunatus parietis]|uniref:Acetamidase/formamidase n=1 Tax=Microlunatus parietis TaxID=682979 RepID=A0A7Y9LAJ2_9ACTN|nr:acetamidase/formamidase family protein [Microlunatus parietis]NYE69645.1 acetamidase/formamidase [Microlunatus parietis]
MDTVEFTPTPEQLAWTFGGVEPIMKVKPGTTMRLWCEDAYAGRVRSPADLPSQCIDINQVNPQTGPFHVEGAEPGDTLALHFVELEPARDWGVSTTIPFFGGLTGTDRTALLHGALPEVTWIYQYDSVRQSVTFEAARSDFRVDWPAEPMLGTVGVAPPAREVRSSLVPERFGGNMDTPELKAGATCYLGVNVPGALFSIGDGHYRQGEGEACGTAVEGAMNVTLIVELIKGGAPLWPRIEQDDWLIAVGSSRPLEDAWRIAQVEMITWLAELYGLDRMDGYQVVSQLAKAPIANVVDANYSSVVKLPKALLPAASAYDGMHRHLRTS